MICQAHTTSINRQKSRNPNLDLNNKPTSFCCIIRIIPLPLDISLPLIKLHRRVKYKSYS